MSNKELDNLFKQKLESLEKTPSADAWSRISAQTQTKQKVVYPYMKIAAAILLLFIIGGLVWYAIPVEKSMQPISQDVSPDTTNQAEKFDSKTESALDAGTQFEKQKNDEKIQDAQNLVASTASPEAVKPTKSNTETLKENLVNENKIASIDEKTEIQKIDQPNTEDNIAIISQEHATSEQKSASTLQQQDASEASGTTLVFDLSDFEKTAIASNEQTNESSSVNTEEVKGLKKILNKVKEIKNETGIGELREAKNEILAFNFKKDNGKGE